MKQGAAPTITTRGTTHTLHQKLARLTTTNRVRSKNAFGLDSGTFGSNEVHHD